MSNPWNLDDEGKKILQKVEEIAVNVVRPNAKQLDKDGGFPTSTMKALRDAGLLGLVNSKKVGGHGMGLRMAVAICDLFGRECLSTAMVTKMHYCGAAVIEQHGNEELRRSITEGGKTTTLAFSEYGSRSHFWIPVGTAKKTSDGIKLNASKQLITSAGHADIYVWSSKPAEAEGLSSIFAVPSNSNGLSVSSKLYDGLGLRGNASSGIAAKDVVIPHSHLLGEDGKGFDIMMQIVMPYFSFQNCACSIGSMEGVLEQTIRHVTKSKYTYNDSSIADFPQVRGHIAKMRVKTDMVRGLLLDALNAAEQGREDVMLRVLESKVAGAETSLEVHDLAMRVCGGAAYRKDIPVERYFRDSRAAGVMAPVSDALYEFIGKAVCGMPVF